MFSPGLKYTTVWVRIPVSWGPMQSTSATHGVHAKEGIVRWVSSYAKAVCICTNLHHMVAAFNPDADSEHEDQGCSGVCSAPLSSVDAWDMLQRLCKVADASPRALTGGLLSLSSLVCWE